jgi:hypothetical protein
MDRNYNYYKTNFTKNIIICAGDDVMLVTTAHNITIV